MKGLRLAAMLAAIGGMAAHAAVQSIAQAVPLQPMGVGGSPGRSYMAGPTGIAAARRAARKRRNQLRHRRACKGRP